MGNRFRQSWIVARESWAVLRKNPALSLFPILSAIFIVIASAPFAIGLWMMTPGGQPSPQNFGPAHYALVFSMYVVDYFVVVFFNVALVACAYEDLQGRATSVSYGIQQASSRLPQILGWSLIAATVGTILRAISERGGTIGRLVSNLVGLAWNVTVFFVIPGLAIERLGPVRALKESTTLLKQTWGERVILGVGIGSVSFALMLFGLVPFIGGVALLANEMVALGIVAILGAVLYWMALSVVFSSLGVIFQTALYMHCKQGMAPSAFSPDTFSNAFREKPASKFFK